MHFYLVISGKSRIFAAQSFILQPSSKGGLMVAARVQQVVELNTTF
nr:MAG TPA: hypothetical protein [Caudoviricetes sp.]